MTVIDVGARLMNSINIFVKPRYMNKQRGIHNFEKREKKRDIANEGQFSISWPVSFTPSFTVHETVFHYCHNKGSGNMTSLKIKLSITRNGEDVPQEDQVEESRLTNSLGNLDFNDPDDDLDLFQMQVESSGKFTRKASWDDLNRFTGKEINSDVFRDMVVHYQETCFPEGKMRVAFRLTLIPLTFSFVDVSFISHGTHFFLCCVNPIQFTHNKIMHV